METIFALATVFGKSGVAVLRVSGKKAAQVFVEFGVPVPPARQAKLAKLRHSGELIDHALCLFFPAPNSFTGEDVVELHVHGGAAIIKKTLRILSELEGFRMAEAGEFARRAFLNGKFNLLEAEGLADLIDAQTDLQHSQAMRQLQGELSAVYEGWRAQLVALLARVEAYIDFPDEDLPQELLDEIAAKIELLHGQIEHYLNDSRRGEKIREGLYITILGAPNVGKSSLLNFLAKREAAIVSNIAGTTRDVVEVQLEIAGLPLTFADTAGIREAQDEIESEGIRRALARAENSDLKIIMYSAAEKLPENLRQFVDAQAILLQNKIDIAGALSSDNVEKSHQVSIATGDGMPSFLQSLEEKICAQFARSEPPIITRVRHRTALQKTLASLASYSPHKPIELMSEDLRYAAVALGSITGKIEVDELLGEIFSSFCIGK